MSTYVSSVDGYPFDLSVDDEDDYTCLSIMQFSLNNNSNNNNSTSSSSHNNFGDDSYRRHHHYHHLHIIQLWLSRGLVWYYAFNHEEAIVCFQKALDIDKDCVMAYYGISLCHGPNYNTKAMNRDTFPSAQAAYDTSQQSLKLSQDPVIRSSMSDVELSLVQALSYRYKSIDDYDTSTAEYLPNTELYTSKLLEVYKLYPNVPDVACMYAESLMNVDPWKLWDLNTGVPLPNASEAQHVLEQALCLAPYNPGLNHFYIHLMEMSPTPEVALPSCSALRRYCPSAGHLQHMPSHIYVLLGMWHDAVKVNINASIVDSIYVLKEGIFNCYTGYRIHNLHFIAYAAMFLGSFQHAMEASHMINQSLPDELLRDPVWNKYFESFLSVELHVLIRFGMWDDILKKAAPKDKQLHSHLNATFYYAQGIAWAVLGNTLKASESLLALKEATQLVPVDHVIHNNNCSKVLEIAHYMLLGEILYRQKSYEDAYSTLEKAASLSEDLVYDEPWGWMQPPAHALGALLLEQGLYDEAERWFRRDMDRSYIGRCHPQNVWSLTGLVDCLQQKKKHTQKMKRKMMMKMDGLRGHVDTSSDCSISSVTKEYDGDDNNNNNNNGSCDDDDDDGNDRDDDHGDDVDRELMVLKEQLIHCKSFCDVDISKACLCAVGGGATTTQHCCSTIT